MDYEKKYKEAQKWIESIYSELSHEQQMEAEAFFPELKESEDEKIRKWLISQLKIKSDDTNFDLNIMIDKAISWLEKQGEPQDKGEISDGYHTFNELYYYRMLYNAAFFNMLPKEWVHKSKKHHDGEDCFGGGWFIVMANLPTGQISNHYELKDWDLFQIPEKERADKWDGHTPQEAAERLHKFLLENQGEQKLTDKVEPKFKIGDWITNDYCAGKVIELTNDAYLLDTGQGIPFSCEHNVHLWTIQDAKDGDVLACPLPKGCESGEQIFIFKEINSRDYVENCIEYYCRVCEGEFYENENGNGYMGTTSSPLYPATKEQRNLLFQKIKDAGYKWDEGKKELRKIEQKPQRMISAEAKESLLHDKYEGLTDFERTLADICIGWIGQEPGWKQYIKDNADVLLKIAIKMFNSVQDAPFEQKPTDNDMVEALRMEYEKGRADVLRCIDPDEMVADFCSQPLSKTRSLASIYRQGIIDIIKRINNNEKTSITGTRSIDDCGL